MIKEEVLVKLQTAEKYFTREKYRTSVSLARKLYEQGNFSSCKEVLSKLPTSDVLLSNLLEKLKGKSIYRTLKKIHENKDESNITKLKGLSSLITHTIIEMEKGNNEYGMLIPILLEKESELAFEL